MEDKSFDKFYDKDTWYYQLVPSEELVDFFEASENEEFNDKFGLDLGCGEGRDSIFLAGRGLIVSSVDIANSGLNKLSNHAKMNDLNINCIKADIREFYIHPKRYKFINAVTVLNDLEYDEIVKLCERITNGLDNGGVAFIEVFTVDDPGYFKKENISETSIFVKHYFRNNELLNLFSDLEVIYYCEKIELDESHGPVHNHGVAILIARKKLK